MIEKVVHKYALGDKSARLRDLAYWRSRPAEERIAAVDRLRSEVLGAEPRLQRVIRIVDLADVDAAHEAG